VWTAASKDYALFIVQNILLTRSNRKLDWILFSYHCDISKKEKKGSKDLNMLWDVYKLNGYSLDNTVIIDDHPDVYKLQKDNCIHITPFELEEMELQKDKTLYTIKKILMQEKFKQPNEYVGKINKIM